ncbi:Dabb family protein [Mesobacterium sp. TK19101]|uniref:Dabb family protein n=1 Tax=Mesobacterium hydrothermale TaxID=3111907 RepID=A0ABU6HKT9_9RHOB|nr:Dabb family protein [Mesobacterium sp. TK19101]MEC3862906.1 Dabb family protein [Mesobacterium sp. TK19101]
MIRHCVFLRLRPDADKDALDEVMQGLQALTRRLAGAGGFVCGPNADFEGKTPEYPAGFTIDFADAEALATYARDPDHRALGARLVALCDGGAAGITVYDLRVEG